MIRETVDESLRGMVRELFWVVTKTWPLETGGQLIFKVTGSWKSSLMIVENNS